MVYEYLTCSRWAVSFVFCFTQNLAFRFIFVKILMQSASTHVCVHVTHAQNWHVSVCVQIHTSLINGRPSADDPSPKLLEFTSARYIRLRLQRIRTLNADLMTLSHRDLRDLDPIVTRRVSICRGPDHLEGLDSRRILCFLWLAMTTSCHLWQSFVGDGPSIRSSGLLAPSYLCP